MSEDTEQLTGARVLGNLLHPLHLDGLWADKQSCAAVGWNRLTGLLRPAPGTREGLCTCPPPFHSEPSSYILPHTLTHSSLRSWCYNRGRRRGGDDEDEIMEQVEEEEDADKKSRRQRKMQ